LRISPDGALIAFADHPMRTDDRGDLRVATRDGTISTLAQGLSTIRGIAWTPDGRAVWFSVGGSIREVTLSGASRTVYSAPQGLRLYDIGRNGDVLIGSQDSRVGINGLLRGDPAERELTWIDYSVVSDISPDGAALLFYEASGPR
jgi:sugar lactone lactonase YvrE